MMKSSQVKVLNWMRLATQRVFRATPCVLLAVALGGCGESETDGVDSGAAAPEASEATVVPEVAANAVSDPKIVTGKVLFAGTPPERAPLQIDEECKEHVGGGPILSEALVVGTEGGLRWAFVYVSNPPEGDYPPPEEMAVLDQVGCAYTPHVFGVQAGQGLLVVNSDPLTHNVRAIARVNRAINYGQPGGSEPRVARATLTAKDENAIQINCDIHRWMRGFMFVKDHPFFAVTGEDGGFAIEGLPDGAYDLTIWHEKLGEQVVSITVEGGSASVEVTFEG